MGAVPIRRMLRWLLIGLTLLVLAPLAIIQLLLLAPGPREFVKRQIVTALGPVLGGGRLEIDELEALSLLHVRVRGARMLGKQGERLASLDRVDALLNPLTLVRKRLTITSLSVSRPFVDFGAPFDEGGGLLEQIGRASCRERV